ncbi:MAG: ATP synthase F1 subunit gamma [Clostridiales bacterium]|uniref:ATP synthase F1 subunit gamma n=1 Tax=Terrisporobacter sp. TaxID=1965305 RepID=UPI002A4D7E21|nr:ATP synthase F1 subunit gamma [Terrisporobacter sp.]MCI5629009.1 ATP synthase F1 subunit gamma [Clostridium sp.]MDD5880142.1 ATP synthase F1 subunit gamma [Clostridiales bacterium]MCI6458627.1 ATP synthase F1 subunit gamma [Clostridium sp.]MCI7208076.1 ATP synthase F1 subunit gamma [Clostridium sp.]MDD7753977.1 ATP synthase F1 subunit gamma [Clostridiales bacterium]
MAGAGIKEIKTRINSVNSTKQVTKAMELVASSKMRKAKDRALAARPYFGTMYNTVKDIATNTRGVRNVFLKQREVKNRCYIVVAGDRGLAGGYNSNITKLTLSHMDGKKEKVMTVGKKSTEFFSKRGYDILKSTESVEKCDYNEAIAFAQEAMDLYKKGEIDEVYMVYTEFVSPLTQNPKLLKVLPLAFEEENKETKEQAAKKARVQYLPSAEVVLGHIIPKYVSGIVYDGIIESFASEQAARRTAMSSATDNADEMLSNLELSYNRARQSAVTQEITEIVGGVEALK